jgi:hypothetical protein
MQVHPRTWNFLWDLICGFYLALAVAEISLPWDYRDLTSCRANSYLYQQIGAGKWFMIHGCHRVAVRVLVVAQEKYGDMVTVSETTRLTAHVFYNLSETFEMAWLLVGATLLWHECPDSGIKSINRLATLVLVCGALWWFTKLGLLIKRTFFVEKGESKKEPTSA